MHKTIRKTLIWAIAPVFLAGCSGVSVATNDPSASHMVTSSVGLPMARALAKRLPAGVFYILAGSDAASYNLWEVSNNGQEIRLTHNGSGLGISTFDASTAGIVMADAASKYDEIARLTPKGAIFLKNRGGQRTGHQLRRRDHRRTAYL